MGEDARGVASPTPGGVTVCGPEPPAPKSNCGWWLRCTGRMTPIQSASNAAKPRKFRDRCSDGVATPGGMSNCRNNPQPRPSPGGCLGRKRTFVPKPPAARRLSVALYVAPKTPPRRPPPPGINSVHTVVTHCLTAIQCHVCAQTPPLTLCCLRECSSRWWCGASLLQASFGTSLHPAGGMHTYP